MEIEKLKLPGAHLPFHERESGLPNVLFPFRIPKPLKRGIDFDGRRWIGFVEE